MHRKQFRSIPDIDLTGLIASFCIGDAVRNAKAVQDVEMMLSVADYDVADIHLYDFEDLWPAGVEWLRGLTDGRPIWVTEFGGPNPDVEPQDPQYQAKRLNSYSRMINTLPLARAYYFKLLDDDNSIHNLSGLYDQRGQAKPALAIFEGFQSER